MSPIINSFVYRKKVRDHYEYYYVNLFTEKVKRLSEDLADFVQADDEVTLTYFEELTDDKYSVIPFVTYHLILNNAPANASVFTLDDLIVTAYKAADIYLKSKDLS